MPLLNVNSVKEFKVIDVRLLDLVRNRTIHLSINRELPRVLRRVIEIALNWIEVDR